MCWTQQVLDLLHKPGYRCCDRRLQAEPLPLRHPPVKVKAKVDTNVTTQYKKHHNTSFTVRSTVLSWVEIHVLFYTHNMNNVLTAIKLWNTTTTYRYQEAAH